MQCPQCNKKNADTDNYCSQCGTNLRTGETAAQQVTHDELANQVELIVKERFIDQRLLVVETAENIASKLYSWATMFFWFVGVPLGIAAALFVFFGFQTWFDVSNFVKEQKSALKEETDKLNREYAKRKKDLEKIDVFVKNVTNLQKRLDDVEEKVAHFVPSSPLTAERKQKIERLLQGYHKFLFSLGFQIPSKAPKIHINPKVKNNAYYDSKTKRMAVAPSMADDPDVILHTYSHHVIMPYFASSARTPDLEEALADYFPCSFQNDAKVGEVSAKTFPHLSRPFLRNLENQRKFSEGNLNALFRYAEIWGGAFWESRNLLGREEPEKPLKFDRLLADTILTKPLAGKVSDPRKKFVEILLQKARDRYGEETELKIKGVFERRDFGF